MVRRVARGFFGGLTVFPGGGVEPYDSSEATAGVVHGRHPDRSHRAAALRELAEETGIALTTDGPVRSTEAKGSDLYEELAGRGVALDADLLTLVSRWITPSNAPTRYDTRFYLAVLVGDHELRIDHRELSDAWWVAPGEALRRHRIGVWSMVSPTLSHLRWLSRRGSIEEALASAEGADARTAVEPLLMEDGSLVPVLVPTTEQ